MDFSLIISSFIAGLLMFLAPCTLPLVPGYLGFISGVSATDLSSGKVSGALKRKVFMNGLYYVLGFSVVFVILGSLFGLGGGVLIQHRLILSRIGGIVVILFGLYMILSQFSFAHKLNWLQFFEKERRLHLGNWFKPGKPLSSFVFGATFAFGWSPCVGPILGTVLLLASQGATVGQGAFLLTVFSLGLAIPFLLIAYFLGSANEYLQRFRSYLAGINFIGGIFLLIIGYLLFTDGFGQWIGLFYRVFDFINYELLLNYL